MEDYGNGQQSGIISGLDNETVSAMKNAQKNFNDDFMNGASTSGFRDYKKSGNKDDLGSVGENLSGIVNGVNNASQLIDSIITPKLVSYCTAYITNVVTTYMADAVTDILSVDASAIVARAGGFLQDYIIGPAQIMQELLSPREALNDQLVADMQNELVEKINEKIGEKVSKITEKAQEQLDKINPTIAAISYYSQMGPVWVQSKLDLAIGKIVENSLSGIGQARDDAIKQRDELIDNLAKKKAEEMSTKINDTTTKGVKKQLDDLEKKKQDALNKVKVQITNVKLKLFALIGA